MTQFAEVNAQDPEDARAAERLAEAQAAFQESVARAATPQDESGVQRLAEAATQLGHTFLWQKKGPEATEAYALAAAWNPQAFDYAQALDALRGVPKDLEDDRPSGFRAALEGARALREERALPADAAAGTLLWWLGWARFAEGEFAGSEEAFQAALALVPEFTNAWFYVGLARQYRKDSEGALQAMHAGWDADPASMVATAAGAGGALRAFESLLGWCAGQEPPRNLDAAFLAELLAEAMPNEARHWNNLGLFLRDEGERLEYDAYKNKTPAPEAALLADLYQRSMRAYRRALELNPDDPQLINDTALMLHYHLDGDPAEVEPLYRRSLDRIDELLAGQLTESDHARYVQTQKDIAFNLKALLDPRDEFETVADDASQKEDAASPTAASASTDGSGG
jgi:tetratricopeptide (TPR) repeat protein